MEYEMNGYKLAGLASLKNFAKSNIGIAIAFFSYLSGGLQIFSLQARDKRLGSYLYFCSSRFPQKKYGFTIRKRHGW